MKNFIKRLFSNDEANFQLQVNTLAIFGALVVAGLLIFMCILNF
jgi:hypothetical protein